MAIGVLIGVQFGFDVVFTRSNLYGSLILNPIKQPLRSWALPEVLTGPVGSGPVGFGRVE